MQQILGQNLPSWTLLDVWVELLFEGYEEWHKNFEDGVCVPIFDDSTGEWEISSGSGIRDGLGTLRELWNELCVG